MFFRARCSYITSRIISRYFFRVGPIRISLFLFFLSPHSAGSWACGALLCSLLCFSHPPLFVSSRIDRGELPSSAVECPAPLSSTGMPVGRRHLFKVRGKMDQKKACVGCGCQSATQGGAWVCEMRVSDFLC